MIARLLVLLLLCTAQAIAADSPSDQFRADQFASAPDAVRPPLLGSLLPEARLHTIEGAPISLSEARAGDPAVLVFYRGGWCPYCNLQLSQLRLVFPQLRELGYRLIAISPDRPEELSRTLDKTALDYTLLSDSQLSAIAALGIGFVVDDATLKRYRDHGIDLQAASGQSHHVLPVPAVFVVDAKGVIQFHYVNPDYRIRVPGELILTAAKVALEIKPLK